MQNEGTEVARKLLQHSFGGGHEISQLIGPSRLEVLDSVSAVELAALIRDESLQTQATILAHIEARKSFETLEELPLKLRSQVLIRISKLEPTSATSLDDLNRRLQEKVQSLKDGG